MLKPNRPVVQVERRVRRVDHVGCESRCSMVHADRGGESGNGVVVVFLPEELLVKSLRAMAKGGCVRGGMGSEWREGEEEVKGSDDYSGREGSLSAGGWQDIKLVHGNSTPARNTT